jgi:Sulfotransferase domain
VASVRRGSGLSAPTRIAPVPTIRVGLDAQAYLRELVSLLAQGCRRFLVRGLTPDALTFAALAAPFRQQFPFVLQGADRRTEAPCPSEWLERVSLAGSLRPDAPYDAVFVFATVGLDDVLREIEQAGGGPTLVVPDLPFRGPAVVFVSLPKAASSWMAATLATGLGTRVEHVSVNTFPTNSIDALALDRVVREGLVTQDHLDASLLNLQTLRQLAPRCIVNVRDPRPALLSLAHFLAYRQSKGHSPVELLRVCPAPSRALLAEPLATQLDWFIDHHLPVWVRWIDNWARVADTRDGLNLLLTDYEELVRDEERQLRRILSFVGVPQARFVMPTLERSMETTTFRRGDPTEWLSVFSAAQRQRAAAMIPAALRARFGWTDR